MTATDASAIRAADSAPPHEVSAAVTALQAQIREAAGAGRRSLATRRPVGVSPGVLRESLLVLVADGFLVNNHEERGREVLTIDW